ncbi:MAG: hypothetical protein ACMXYA_03250, partial [Candidatus Woesearchaeota archaeon]
MDIKTIQSAISQLHEDFKRNFVQSYELVVNLKDLNLKKPDEQVDFFSSLTKPVGKKVKVCGLM